MNDPHKWNGWKLYAAVLALVGALFAQPGCADEKQADKGKEVNPQPENPFPNRPPAQPLDGGTAWLNSAGPIELSKLKGKIVLLDFWTYCCINCIHVLPDLAKLEEEFADELVVIGVHSAKFPGEKVTDNIREAIVRYEIKHPVVNDSEMLIWRNYGVRSWPTLVLIDPEGRYLGYISGEGNYEILREIIQRLIAYHGSKGTLDRTPMHFQLEAYGKESTPLRYPGKLALDPDNNRILIADSSHHRVVVAKLDTGEVTDVIGTGQPGMKDGSFAEAQFNDPQGMAVSGDIVYLADRKNHSLRKIDLKNKTVTLLAGKGEKGYDRHRIADATDIVLASPWDLELVGNQLYVAMAGTHQIWKMDLERNRIGSFAGTGRESIEDGPAGVSAFSQPSGLAYDGKFLYVADSEVSAIRKINVAEEQVDTVVGTGLFDFGDVDGVGDRVRLQHALGVAYKDGKLYVADTYNNKIKMIDPATRTSTSFVGDGKPSVFDEPAGIEVLGDTLYVADTNNHRIRAVDIKTKEVRDFELKGLTPPPKQEAETQVDEKDVTTLDAVSLKAGAAIEVAGSVEVPKSQKLNPQAPMTIQVETLQGKKWNRLTSERIKPVQPEFTAKVESVPADVSKLRFTVTYYPCDIGSEGVCHVRTRAWELPVSGFAEDGIASVQLKP